MLSRIHHASFERRYDVETTSCAYRVDTHNKIVTAESFLILLHSLQTHHMYSTVKRRGNEHFYVVSAWNTRGLFAGLHQMRTQNLLKCQNGAFEKIINSVYLQLRCLIGF